MGIFTRRRVLVAAGAVGLAISLLLGASVMDSLRTELHFDERTYRPGESVPFALSACSTSLLPMRTEGGKPSWRITNEAGDVVADSRHQVFTLELEMLTWSPRQCRRVLSVGWDQREWNQREPEVGEPTGVPRRGATVPAGEYAMEVFWGDLKPKRATFLISESPR